MGGAVTHARLDRQITEMLALTAVAGLVDAVSYLALDKVFTGNITGNVALLGFSLITPSTTSRFGSVLALASFLSGAVIGGRLSSTLAGVGQGTVRLLRTGLFVETILLAAAAILTGLLATGPETVRAVVTVLLALGMGLQAAVARRVGVADLRTTVITTTLVALAADSHLAGGSGVRWVRRAGAGVALLGGAAAGAALVRVHPAWALAAAAATSAVIATGYALRPPSR
jgi:uncharacterized membrane protein YoaK (UPF0700 family)